MEYLINILHLLSLPASIRPASCLRGTEFHGFLKHQPLHVGDRFTLPPVVGPSAISLCLSPLPPIKLLPTEKFKRIFYSPLLSSYYTASLLSLEASLHQRTFHFQTPFYIPFVRQLIPGHPLTLSSPNVCQGYPLGLSLPPIS